MADGKLVRVGALILNDKGNYSIGFSNHKNKNKELVKDVLSGLTINDGTYLTLIKPEDSINNLFNAGIIDAAEKDRRLAKVSPKVKFEVFARI